MTTIGPDGHVYLDVVRPDGHHEEIDLGPCECELDWNCGCGRYGGLPPIDVLNTWWSQDHP